MATISSWGRCSSLLLLLSPLPTLRVVLHLIVLFLVSYQILISTYCSVSSPSKYHGCISESIDRDVHIYDANDTNEVLGGLILTHGVTNANFYSMVEVFVVNCKFVLRYEDGMVVMRDEQALRRGKYYLETSLAPDVSPTLGVLLLTLLAIETTKGRYFPG